MSTIGSAVIDVGADPTERRLRLLVRLLSIVLVLGVVGLTTAYVAQRSLHSTVSVVDRDLQTMESEVRQQPNDPSLRVALANVYLAGNRLSDAITQSEQVLAIEPGNVEAAVVAAQAYVARGQADRAITSLSTALAIGAEDPMTQTSLERGVAHQLLGRLQLEQGNPGAAVSELQLALQVDHTNADTLHLLGKARGAQGDAEGAVAAYETALRFVPDFAEVYQDLAIVFDQIGQPARARFARAMLQYANADYSQAAAQLTQSVAELPDVAEVHLGLAMAEEHLGHNQVALTEYRVALDLDGSSFAARQGVGRLGGQP